VSLASVCAEIVDVLSDPASGIAQMLPGPPINVGTFPAAWVNPVRGTVTPQSGDHLWLHQIELIVYVTPLVFNIPAEFARVAPLVNSIEQTIWAAYEQNVFSPNVSRCVVSAYAFGIRDLQGKPVHSLSITLDVKEHTQ